LKFQLRCCGFLHLLQIQGRGPVTAWPVFLRACNSSGTASGSGFAHLDVASATTGNSGSFLQLFVETAICGQTNKHAVFTDGQWIFFFTPF